MSAIAIGTDNSAAIRAEHIWNWTGLPEPEDGEYVYGSHGVQVFLNRFGLLFNFRNRRFPRSIYDSRVIQHDKILQPLYRRDLSRDTTFEICPGIKRTGTSEGVLEKLKKGLKKSGLDFYDPQSGYVGILPGQDEQRVVIANRSAIRVKRKEVQSTIGPLVQDKIFGALKQEMEEAFSSASADKVQEALKNCARIVALPETDPAKILYASWTNRATLGPSKDNIVATATAYDRKLVL